jgi:hypothetical protein
VDKASGHFPNSHRGRPGRLHRNCA